MLRILMKRHNVKLYMITSGFYNRADPGSLSKVGGGVLEMFTWGVQLSSIKENYVKLEKVMENLV